ncbi:MAG: hypothetical protein KKF62_09675 [Bacteroidetes bacterium]|nr:hypothetical protein [Bacteroidota bacterium]MBU1114427.1 hypothetical protein [Bacteroidota bacterium]MBU1798830.1 hypothetical protein [Bacteroidota bacterium]
MKNKIKCENCNSENDYFKMNCSNCGSLLRDKYPNIDLFSSIWLLIETPSKALKKIIYSDHKNYLLFLLVLLVSKLVLTSFFAQSVIIKPVEYQYYLSINFGIGFGIILAFILLFPLLQKIVLKNRGILTRYKDNLAVLVFSQIPTILFLLILLPIEFALFGKYWLFSNPSPFMMKETAAYAFSIMEILVFIWSLILLGIGNFIQSNSRVFAFFITILFLFILIGLLLFIPYLG